MTKPIPNERMRRLAQHLYDLGPRPVLEFIKEIVAGSDPVQALEAYGRLDRDVVHALGADRLEHFHVIEGGRQWR